MKRCWWCKEFNLDLGSHGYSEVTPGAPGNIYCSKGHFDIGPSDEDLVYKEIRRAETCPDYQCDRRHQ